jgi:hypothetical protein
MVPSMDYAAYLQRPSYSEGINSRLVWVLDYSGTGDVILGSKNMTIEDLKGKKLGLKA